MQIWEVHCSSYTWERWEYFRLEGWSSCFQTIYKVDTYLINKWLTQVDYSLKQGNSFDSDRAVFLLSHIHTSKKVLHPPRFQDLLNTLNVYIASITQSLRLFIDVTKPAERCKQPCMSSAYVTEWVRQPISSSHTIRKEVHFSCFL